MREFLKNAFGLVLEIFWVILLAILVLFVWIPFAGFFGGCIGLIVGYLLSRGLRACFASPFLLASVLGFAAFFHIFPISYALIRLKNILVRNLKRFRAGATDAKFSPPGMIREMIPVVFGRLPSFLCFFAAGVFIVSFILPFPGKPRKLWDNLDFVIVSTAALFAIFTVFYSLCEWKNSPFPELGNRINKKTGEWMESIKNFFTYRATETVEEIERQKHFDDAPVAALVGLFWGLIGGIAVGISLSFIIIYPVWVLATTAFFSLFHLSDLRRMFREKQWLGFFGRIIILLAFSSYLAGFICFSVIGLPFLFVLFLLFAAPFGMICGLIWSWLDRYFPANRLIRSFDQIFRGLFKLGVFWKER